jgi:hypothetical protein
MTAPVSRNPFKTPSDCPYCPPQQGQNAPPGGIEGATAQPTPEVARHLTCPTCHDAPGYCPDCGGGQTPGANPPLPPEPTPEVERLRAQVESQCPFCGTRWTSSRDLESVRDDLHLLLSVASAVADDDNALQERLRGAHERLAALAAQPTPEVERLRAQVAADAIRSTREFRAAAAFGLPQDAREAYCLALANAVIAALAAQPTKGERR